MYIDNKYNNQIKNWLIFNFILISIIIIVGGLTRLTDSGLSITTWELFKGLLPPLSQNSWDTYFSLYKKIPEFKLQNYNMSLEEFKIIFWWEWVHRFLGRLIGISFIVPLIYFTLKIGYKKLINLYFIFILICFQGFLGWYMVSSGLVNRIDVSHFRLSVHLVVAFIILSLILWNYLKIEVKISNKHKINKLFPLLFLIIIFIQIAIGAFVSGMDAGKIYNSWPLMGNSYFPDDNDISNLFSFRAFSDPSLVQFLHRNLAYLIFIFYLYLLLKIYLNKNLNLYKPIIILGIFIFIQIFLGVLTLLYDAQIILASMHQISSIFLVSSCIYFFYLNTNVNLQPSN